MIPLELRPEHRARYEEVRARRLADQQRRDEAAAARLPEPERRRRRLLMRCFRIYLPGPKRRPPV